MVRRFTRSKKKPKKELTERKPVVETIVPIEEPVVVEELIVETKVALPGLFCPRCGEGMILQKEIDRFQGSEWECPKCGKRIAKM